MRQAARTLLPLHVLCDCTFDVRVDRRLQSYSSNGHAPRLFAGHFAQQDVWLHTSAEHVALSWLYWILPSTRVFSQYIQ